MIRLCLKWRECGSLLTLLTHRLVWEVPRGEGDFRWSGECDQERTYGKSGFELGMNEQVVLGYAERDGGGVGFAWLVYTWEIQFSSVAQLCLTVCDPMDCSMPGFPVHHQLPEFTQTHVHWVGDAIQPSYPLSSPSPPAFNLSQHQGLFQWVSSLHQVAKVLALQLQH